MTYSSEDQLKRRNDEEAAAAAKRATKSKSLDSDEWIAILVAFGVIGTLFFWGLRSKTAADAGGWLKSNDIGLVGEGKGDGAGIAIATGSDDEAEGNKYLGAAPKASGKLTSASSSASGKDDEVAAPSRSNLAGAAAAGGAIAAGAATGTDAAEPPAEPVVSAEASIPTPAEPEAEPAEPLSVASEALDTSVPEVAEDSWVAPFAKSLTDAERFGALPTPDGEGEEAAAFDMDAPVTRAEFAALINEAEQANGDAAAAAGEFADIEETFWAAQGIAGASSSGFMSGYATDSGLAFRPSEQIPRWQVFVTLASGLNLAAPADPDAILSKYDIAGVPDWAKSQVAATIEEGLVVNPNSTTELEASRPTTRGEAVAMLQQVLQRQNKADEVDASDVIVNVE